MFYEFTYNIPLKFH